MKNRKQYLVYVDAAMCKGTEGCGLCLAVCDQDVLRIADGMNSRGVHPVEVQATQQCNGCGLCFSYALQNFMYTNDSSMYFILNQPVDEREEEDIQRAVEVCPMECIHDDGVPA